MRRWLFALLLMLAAATSPARAQGTPELQMRKDKVGDVPVLVYAPKETKGRALVIWVTGFSGSKESVEGHLKTFAQRGYVAMSFDPYQHGDRRIEPNPQLVSRVRGNIRRYFWPILAKSAEEYPQLIDWAIKTYGVRKDVAIGGISMGGDISVTAANVDPRIMAVSACVATPDWMRRGSFEPPGEPDPAAQADFDRRNPSTHVALYKHKPAIAFQSGMEDRQVPPDAAARFLADLELLYGKDKDRLKLNLQPNMGHGFSNEMLQNSIDWIERYVPALHPATKWKKKASAKAPFSADEWPATLNPTRQVHYVVTDGGLQPPSPYWTPNLKILTGGDHATEPVTIGGHTAVRVMAYKFNTADDRYPFWAGQHDLDVLIQFYGDGAHLTEEGKPRYFNFLTGTLPEPIAVDGGSIPVSAKNGRWNWVLFRIPNGLRHMDNGRLIGTLHPKAKSDPGINGMSILSGQNGGTIRIDGLPNLKIRVVAFGERGAFGEPDQVNKF